MRYSVTKSSAMVAGCESASRRNETLELIGDFGRMASSWRSAHSEPSASSAATIASTLSPANRRSMSSRQAAIGARPGSASNSVRMRLDRLRLADDRGLHLGQLLGDHHIGGDAQQLAVGRASRAPVSASQTPARPCSRGRNQPAPTSGKRPMPVSGMAKRVRSVAMR